MQEGRGLIMKIHLPRGARAAFIDAEGVETDRGYQEIVLPRNTPMEATQARLDSQGNKILEVRMKP
ncbi:MAG: hypothetical protein EA369_04235 [Bradymonadales bacterium]|nr:MAG: hypothetical protein EA369_04235 [Bradymonadales bacterium]